MKFFTPRAGDNRLRILPPTWENAEHFGYELFAHYGVGDNSAYLCLDAMHKTKGDCPICIERARADAAGEEDYAYQLRPTKRVSVYVIDRDHPQEGVLLWNMPWTIDRDLCARAVDRMTGEVYNVDDPDAGYDISFTREGQGTTTKYVAIEIARRPSPLSDDPAQAKAWLEYAVAHPIPEQLVYHDAEHIARAFSGAAPAQPAEDAGRPSPAPAAATTAPAPTAARPAARGQAAEVTEAAVMAMTEEQVLALCDERGISEEQIGADALAADLKVFKLRVCELLFPREATEPPKSGAVESLKERMARLRGKTAQ